MSIYDKASLVQIPSGYKSGTLYSVVPNDADGDFDFTRASTGTRVNKDGLIETVSANVPRLNYNFIDGVVQPNPHLLLELARTQLAEYTNAISSANGYSLTNGTLTTDSHTAPDGSNEASTFEATSANGQFQKVKIGSSGVQYTVSAYVKRKTGTGTVYLRAVENTNTAVTIYDYWTRVSLTVTSTSTSIRYGMALETSGDEVYVWGFQVEAGSYPTSLIPNTSSGEITRTLDDCVDAQADFNDAEGVLYVNAKINDPDDADDNDFSLGDGSFVSNSVEISFRNPLGVSQSIVGKCAIDGSTISLTNTTITDQSIKHDLYHKVAYQYKQADFKMFVNGFKIGTSTYNDIFASGVLSRVSFEGNGTSGTKFRGETKELMTFNSAMTDIELETLTSYRSFNSMAKELLFTIE